MTEGDVFIRYAEFPYTVKGVTVPNDDGTFSIYINSALPESQQKAALRHELCHVRGNHFYDGLAAYADETAANNDRTEVPAEALVFARGGGLVTGRRRQRFLALLDATIDRVFERL